MGDDNSDNAFPFQLIEKSPFLAGMSNHWKERYY